jgi:5'-deoxynucleotidase YfbR-like HD superfamily hydrolase
MSQILTILRSGLVHRFHTVPNAFPQNVAAHSWGVACIYAEIGRKVTSAGLIAALHHDCAELFTGDVPAPVKWQNVHFADALAQVEKRIEAQLSIDYDLDQIERDDLKTADMLELVWWSRVQTLMGNSAFLRPLRNGREYLLGLGEDRFHIKARQVFAAITNETEI